MKKLVVASLAIALAGFVATPQTARADDGEVLAAIGGFIGGVIVGSASRDSHREPEYHRSESRGSRVVIVEGGSRRGGHWEWVSVKSWVPARWVVRHDDCGVRVRYFQRGFYEYRKERVWVDHRGDRDYDRRYDGRR